MKSVSTVFPTMLKRKEWKGECGKALCTDSAHWHWNGQKIVWKFQGGQGEGSLCLPWKAVKWGPSPRGSWLRGSDQGCEIPPDAASPGIPSVPALLMPKIPSNAPKKQFVSEAQEICGVMQTVYRLLMSGCDHTLPTAFLSPICWDFITAGVSLSFPTTKIWLLKRPPSVSHLTLIY